MKEVTVLLMIQLLCAVSCNKTKDFILCLYQDENNCQTCTLSSTEFIDNVLPSGNFAIQFCSAQFHLSLELSISNRHAVNITGNSTKIICNPPNQGAFIFDNVSNLLMQNIAFESCGHEVLVTQLCQSQDLTQPVILRTSIYVASCTNVTIREVSVTGSIGNGLTMINNDGMIQIENCHFSGSKRSSEDLESAGSGLYIALSFCQSSMELDPTRGYLEEGVTNSHYTIANCNFSGNADNETDENSNTWNDGNKFFHGRGGGLCLVLDSSYNVINVTMCNFMENSAVWGGGMYAVITRASVGNNLSVLGCDFYKNRCSQGGGGVDLSHNSAYPRENIMIFEGCSFHENDALFGGGTRVHSNDDQSNKIFFRDCSWTKNKAVLAAAVDISHFLHTNDYNYFKAEIIFGSCVFESNELSRRSVEDSHSFEIGSGSFLAVGYRVQFEGSTTFDNNSGSAMYLSAAQIEFKPGSEVIFSSNTGFEGGAISMHGFSVLFLYDNVKVNFTNNSALTQGGAIYQRTSDVMDFFVSQHCFIAHKGNGSNVSLVFEDNTAGQQQGSVNGSQSFIYTSTIMPCSKSKQSVLNFTDKISIDQISTPGSDIALSSNLSEVWAVPGKWFQLSLESRNDLNVKVSTLYYLSVESGDTTSISVEEPYIFNKSVRIFGTPGHNATLLLETIGIRHIVLEFQVAMMECPPGFSYNKTEKRCLCFSYHNRRYSGLLSCGSRQEFYAEIGQGYWMGYEKEELVDGVFGMERFLLYSFCPLGFCLNGNEKRLPNDTNQTQLELVICSKGRHSTLCSLCRKGYASHYHDYDFSCKPVHKTGPCKLGWLFYILSEIVPITIFFSLVMVFNIRFTDGAISGFLLYIQLSDVLHLQGNGIIALQKHARTALEIYRIVTRIFNLNFFTIDSLSFCLWEKATVLDLVAFKYITILYSLLLVLAIVAVFRYFHGTRIIRALSKIGHSRNEESAKGIIIHGLSGFLVICYAECTRISLFLLTPGYIYIYRNSKYTLHKTVSFYNGDLKYLGGKHLAYALPALLILLILGVIPPLVLIAYPLCYKVLAVLKLSESKVSKLLCLAFPLENFRPFFDSFQSCFKDEYRFFSGLYFVYRFMVLGTFLFSRLHDFYVVIQIQLIVFLLVHALCQPYRKHLHNVLDALLFTNLAALNALTLSSYNTTFALHNDLGSTTVMISIVQILLLYSVLVCFMSYMVSRVIVKLRVGAKLRCKKRFHPPKPDDYHELSHQFSLNAAENRNL